MTQSIEPRLLIVDDDTVTIRLLIQILDDMGTIHFTTRGSEAVDMARSISPDLILLDVEMPDIDGISVCERIKSDPAFQDVPILFVTVHSDVDMEVRALAAGAVDFITKPPHPHVVRARVKSYLALKQRSDQLRRLTTIDGLTGVGNRRAFDAALDIEWRRACRTGEPLSLLMIDVDHFKRFNDSYGHQAGDDCLRGVAQTLAAAINRPGDVTARYGGEEFAMLLPNCVRDHAVTFAETVLTRVAALGVPHAASDVASHVTVSIGAASFTSVCQAERAELRKGGGCSILESCRLGSADLLKAADLALYEAKNGGRNRVAAFEPLQAGVPDHG